MRWNGLQPPAEARHAIGRREPAAAPAPGEAARIAALDAELAASRRSERLVPDLPDRLRRRAEAAERRARQAAMKVAAATPDRAFLRRLLVFVHPDHDATGPAEAAALTHALAAHLR
jgi:hypothetical protein